MEVGANYNIFFGNTPSVSVGIESDIVPGFSNYIQYVAPHCSPFFGGRIPPTPLSWLSKTRTCELKKKLLQFEGICDRLSYYSPNSFSPGIF